jgi:hypothetical protein
MENVFDREKIYFFTSNEITGHIRFINNLNGGRCISLNKLLKLSRSFKIDLNGIFNLNVPETYITSLRNYRSRFEKGTLGVCLAPWCNSYKSNKSLVYINCYKFNRSNYFACVCKECFNKYGINEKTGKWDNMGGFIDLLWNKVLPSLKSGASLNSIKTKYKTSWERIINAIEYAVNHGLLDGELHEEYSVNNIPNNIISYFSYLYDTSGSMSKNARKCFKWNSREFYYYLNIKKVQRYLLFERDMFLVKNADNYGKSRRKKELEELLKYYIDIDKDINVGNVIIGLNCSDNTIYRNKLENIIRSAARKQAKKRKALKTKYIINKVKEYFREKDLADDLLTCSQVYKDLKICNGESGEEKKEIRRVVSSKVKEYNTEVKSNRIKKLNKQLDKIVKQFYILGKNATYKEIAFQLGISQSTLDRNTVLKKAIRETIKKYYY